VKSSLSPSAGQGAPRVNSNGDLCSGSWQCDKARSSYPLKESFELRLRINAQMTFHFPDRISRSIAGEALLGRGASCPVAVDSDLALGSIVLPQGAPYTVKQSAFAEIF
jgi:hypothetical protein